MEIFNWKLTYLCEKFISFDDYQKPVDNLKKEDFFSKLKKMSWWLEMERTKEVIKLFNIKNAEKLTQL